MSGDKGLPLGMIMIVLTVVAAVVLLGGLVFVLPTGRPQSVQVGTTSRAQLQARVPQTLHGSAPPGASESFAPGMHAEPSPLAAERFVASNGWRGRQDTTLIEVWAGMSPSAAAQGLIVFRTWTQGHVPPGFSFRPTPTKSGAVEIVDAAGMQLTLRSEDGTAFTFDAVNGEYL